MLFQVVFRSPPVAKDESNQIGGRSSRVPHRIIPRDHSKRRRERGKMKFICPQAPTTAGGYQRMIRQE